MKFFTLYLTLMEQFRIAPRICLENVHGNNPLTCNQPNIHCRKSCRPGHRPVLTGGDRSIAQVGNRHRYLQPSLPCHDEADRLHQSSNNQGEWTACNYEPVMHRNGSGSGSAISRHRFLAQMSEHKVSRPLCIGKLVSNTDMSCRLQAW